MHAVVNLVHLAAQVLQQLVGPEAANQETESTTQSRNRAIETDKRAQLKLEHLHALGADADEQVLLSSVEELLEARASRDLSQLGARRVKGHRLVVKQGHGRWRHQRDDKKVFKKIKS